MEDKEQKQNKKEKKEFKDKSENPEKYTGSKIARDQDIVIESSE